MDIAWSPHDENRVVSCGSNGELYTLTVSESDIINSNTDVSVMYHKPTIIHPYDRNLLISGGHDGRIKITDLRNPSKPAEIFHHDLEDKVTDCQFNPSPSMENCFASGSDSGFVYIWDSKMSSTYLKKLNPHLSGRVHVDWHPDKPNILASASYDKQISVLDISDKILKEDKHTPRTLTHSESVISIKWRLKRPKQITACSSNGFDSHLYVWDLVRPYVSLS